MRRCLQQRRTPGHRNLSSRFLATTAAQASWRHAVEQKNASVNALVYVVPDDAAPVPEGPLNGLTVAVKDNICTKNMPTTCSSAMLRGKTARPLRARAMINSTHAARLPITLRRDCRTSADSLRRHDHRKDKLRRIRHGVRSRTLLARSSQCFSSSTSPSKVFKRPLSSRTSHQPIPTSIECRGLACARAALGRRQLRRERSGGGRGDV
jgi:hypothetical protein